MFAKTITAITAAKTVRLFLRIFGGGATAAPGLVAERIDPTILSRLTSRLPKKVIITGTNGKTTTSRILSTILSFNGIKTIHNREGSNLTRGIVSTLIEKSNLLASSEADIGVFEVDEATLPEAVSKINPDVIVINNLFRDQLDRYGEVNKIHKRWSEVLANLPSNTTIILNSDDPSVAELGNSTKAKTLYFGIEDEKMSLLRLSHASDFISCLSCGYELKFDHIYLSHLGKYLCNNCGLKRPKPTYFAHSIKFLGSEGSVAKINTPQGRFDISAQIPGLYNLYNIIAAVTAAISLGIKVENIEKSLRDYKSAFGRAEKLEINDKSIFVFLAKNPTGFNEVIRTVFWDKERKNVFLIINDLIADGTDVSWLWDVDFELLKHKVDQVWVSGLRAADMSLRLKYADIAVDSSNVNEDIEESLDQALKKLKTGETLYIFPTYTALLNLQKILRSKKVTGAFWEN